MDPNQQKSFADHLISLLEGQALPGCILLNGKWGSGKTHFCTTSVFPELKRPYIYLSVFGINSAEDLKSKLLSQLILKQKPEETSRLLRLGKELIAKAPKAFGSGLSVYVKNKFGDDAKEFFEIFSLKLDPMHVFPKEMLIFLDDVERKSIADVDFLGVIDDLLRNHKAKIVLIMNAEKTDDRFREYKEKVIWQSFEMKTSSDECYELFTKQFSTPENLELFMKRKSVVMRSWLAGGEKNLRTLQRIIRSIDFIETEIRTSLDEDLLELLGALIVQDATKGNLNANSLVYQGHLHSKATKVDKKMVNELDLDQQESLAFVETFFKRRPEVKFNQELYNFVRTGHLDAQKLRDALLPSDIRSPMLKMMAILDKGDWMYLKDEEVEKILFAMERTIIERTSDPIGLVARFWMTFCKLSRHIGKTIPDLQDSLEARISERVQHGDDPMSFGRFANKQEEANDLNFIVENYRNKSNIYRISSIKSRLLSSFTNNDEDVGELLYERIKPEDVRLLFDDEAFWANLNIYAETHTEMHFYLFQYWVTILSESGHTEKAKALVEQYRRLFPEKESGAKKRAESLTEIFAPNDKE